MILLGFILYGILCPSWTWLTIYFSMLGKFSTLTSSKMFSYTFFFSSSGAPIIQMLLCLILSQRSSETILVSFYSFYFVLLFRSYFHHFIFQLIDSFFCRGSGSIRYSVGLAARAAGNIVLYKGMATHIGQYDPVFLPGEPHSLTEKPDRPQSTGMQRAGHDQSNPVCRDARHFLPVAALPQWELSMKVVWLLGLWGLCRRHMCRDTDCIHHRSYGAIRVFEQASWSRLSEALSGQSFSIALSNQALRRLPCLGSLSVVWSVSHLKEHPGWGPIL